MSYKQTKNTVRKKDGKIIVGDSQTEIRVEGKVNADGNLNIQYPFTDPNVTRNYFRVLFTDGKSYEWKKEQIQSYISEDSEPGLDYVFVNATRGIGADSKVILNPFGATRETGVVAYTLESQVYLKEATSYTHYQGETLSKI